MTASRRTGAETSKTRLLLLQVTERLMVDEGYASVSSRRVATEAGVTAALVHYYFPTLDDLFLATFRRRADIQFEREGRVLSADAPAGALWAVSSDRAGTALMVEFMALANHRKSIRSEIAASAERFRAAEVEVLSDRMREVGIDAEEVPPLAVLLLIASISRVIVMEEALGITTGHGEAVALVDRYVRWLDGQEGADAPVVP